MWHVSERSVEYSKACVWARVIVCLSQRPLTIRTKRHIYSSVDIFDTGAEQLDLKSEGGEAIGGSGLTICVCVCVCIPLPTPQSCGLGKAN